MPSSRKSSKRPWGEPHRELDESLARHFGARVESSSSGESFQVRQSTSTSKTYRCPGCQQEIPPGVKHVVAWTDEHLLGAQAGAEERRHWHTACWNARDRRRPGGKR